MSKSSKKNAPPKKDDVQPKKKASPAKENFKLSMDIDAPALGNAVTYDEKDVMKIIIKQAGKSRVYSVDTPGIKKFLLIDNFGYQDSNLYAALGNALNKYAKKIKPTVEEFELDDITSSSKVQDVIDTVEKSLK